MPAAEVVDPSVRTCALRDVAERPRTESQNQVSFNIAVYLTQTAGTKHACIGAFDVVSRIVFSGRFVTRAVGVTLSRRIIYHGGIKTASKSQHMALYLAL
eukprot:1632187-Rhodomonas_salina.2